MKKELELWRFIAEKLKKKQKVMLLVVTESTGSSPGRRGFKMAVTADEMCGSIGGGVMEVKLVEWARERTGGERSSRKSAIIEQVHRKNAPNSSGMICSGKQTVIFVELSNEHQKAATKILGSIERSEPQILRITNKEFAVFELTKYRPTRDTTQKKDGVFVYEEHIAFKNNLFIVGGGHCALALSEIMARLDFHISLFDDRPNLNTLKKNKFAHEKIKIKSYDDIGDHIPSGDNNYVVVMTLGFASDAVVIRQLLNKKFKYFGVLGSRAKMKTLLRDLEKEGFSKTKLARIHTPIGLPINSRTPEEIAVSIASEIIAVKNKG